jgi:hypothetical protein
LKKCRQWLSDYEIATKTFDIKKMNSMAKHLTLLQNPKEYDTESLCDNHQKRNYNTRNTS